jgi:hypothetical protein
LDVGRVALLVLQGAEPFSSCCCLSTACSHVKRRVGERAVAADVVAFSVEEESMVKTVREITLVVVVREIQLKASILFFYGILVFSLFF